MDPSREVTSLVGLVLFFAAVVGCLRWALEALDRYELRRDHAAPDDVQ